MDTTKVLVCNVEFITFVSQSVDLDVKIIYFPSHIFNSTTKIRDLWDLGVVRLVPGKPLAEDGVSLDESVDCGMYRLPPEPACRAMLLFSSIKLPSTKLLFRIN